MIGKHDLDPPAPPQEEVKKITVSGFFVKGLLFGMPLGLTIYILFHIILFIDNIIEVHNIFKIDDIPGVGTVIVLGGTTLLGILVHYCWSESFNASLFRVLNKVPLFGIVYTTIRDLTESFLGKKKKFTMAVLVDVSEDGHMKRMGFITQKQLPHSFNLPDHVGVYFPNSYSLMGEYCVVHIDKVTRLNIDATEAMKSIVSGGISEL